MRFFVHLLPLLALTSTVALAGAPASSGHGDEPVGVGPREALARLKQGNEWYVAGGRQTYEIGADRRGAVAATQHPYCSLLSCADSRVPPEHVFHSGLGELFTVRVAGNVAEPSSVASLEYAAEHLGSRLIVVMGHERCGAVKAAQTVTTSLGPNLDTLLSYIKPHLGAGDTLDTAIYANIRAQMDGVMQSDILRHLVAAGKVQVVGARYDLDSGKVEFLPYVAPTERPAPPASTPAVATADHAPTAPAAAPAHGAAQKSSHGTSGHTVAVPPKSEAARQASAEPAKAEPAKAEPAKKAAPAKGAASAKKADDHGHDHH